MPGGATGNLKNMLAKPTPHDIRIDTFEIWRPRRILSRRCADLRGSGMSFGLRFRWGIFERVRALIRPRKPGRTPSKIGHPIDNPDAVPACQLLRGAIDKCTFRYPLPLLVDRPLLPLVRVLRWRGWVTGAPPPIFWGSYGTRPPYQLTSRGSSAALPGGGRSRHNNPCRKARSPGG